MVIREAGDFSSILQQNGFEVLNLPLIRTEPLEDLAELKRELRTLDQYDGLFFTSPVSAEIFLNNLGEAARFNGKVYVLGERTNACFAKTDLELVFLRQANTAEEFIMSFDKTEFSEKKFLFVRGEKSLRTIPDLLASVAIVDEVNVYRTLANEISDEIHLAIREKIESHEIDWICFFSPSGIDAFLSLFPSDAVKSINTGVIGDTTAKRATETKFNVRLISETANAKDFAINLTKYVNKID